MQEKSTTKKKVLQEVLDEIKALCTSDAWEMSLDYLLGLLDSDRVDFLRYCYSLEDKAQGLALGALDKLSSDNTKELIGFLKFKGFQEAEQLFFKAGFYLKAQEAVEYLEFFQSLCQSRLLNHEIDRELLEVALAGCRHFNDAAEFYCHSLFSIDELIEWASSLYLERYEILDHPYSRKILKNYIYAQFSSKSILERVLFAPLVNRLKDKSCLWGFLSINENENKDKKETKPKSKKNLKPQVQAALQVLGIAQEKADTLPSREILKKHYRACLKKYHPDLHKKGHEETRKLIEAYALTLSAYNCSD